METEIKLTVDPTIPGGPQTVLDRLAAVPTLGDHPLGPVVEQQIEDIYYDTPDRRLGAARIGLRVRHLDGIAFLTVKQGRRRTGPLAEREEYEQPLSAAAVQAGLAPLVQAGVLPSADIPLAALATGRPAGPLVPVLATRTHRRQRNIAAPPGPGPAVATARSDAVRTAGVGLTLAHLCLDVVAYPQLGGPPFCDVEVEAVAADLTALEQLAAAVIRAAGGHLAPTAESKLGRGLRLLAGAGS